MFLRNKICLIAIGTVGDVLPLVHVANQLSDDTTVVSFSSHVDHQSWLLPLIKGAGVAFLPIELPPARGPYEGQRPAACASGIEEHLEACIRVCEDALDIKLGGTESDRAQLNHQDGSAVCHRLIVHNLFALEGFHIAEALGVRSLVVSACLPYPPPTAFQTRLKTAYPWLWNALQHQGEGVRWAEIEHWMWPLFTERWGAWRQERLRLPAVPYQTALTLPAAPPLLLCLSPCLVDQLPTWPSSIKVCGSIKPAAECGRVKRKGQHWPGKETSWQKGRCFGKMATAETAAACVGSNVMTGQDRDAPGSGIAEDDHKRESMSESATTYETELMKALKAADRSSAPMNRPKRFTFSQNNGSILDLIGIEVDIVCIDFGSMGSMGLLGDAKQVVEILALALEQSGVCGVLLTGQWDALLDAHMELSNCTTLAAVRGFVDHAELFSHCCAVVHHGGAGTVASALRAGLPSIICPLHFDQFMWADKLEYMGLGKMLPGTIFKESTVGAAAAVLSSALSELMGSHAFQSDCQRMQREMAAEDGTAVAAAHIRQLLRADFEVRPVYKKYGLLELPNGWEVDASSRSEVKFLYREIFEKQTYLQHGITVQDGDVVVDVGANIGLFALHLLVELGKQLSHIWLIEPLKPTVRQLRSNIAAFMAEEQVTVVPMALGRTAATKVFTYYPNMPGNATSKPVEKAALQEGCMHAYYFQDYSTHDCQVTTLDHLMSQHAITKIDLLKVDVEGDEEEVLLGMTQWEAVAQVVAEVHEVDGRAERIKELLQSHGFLVVVDRGSAPSAVMLYAAKEGRLFGESWQDAPRSSRTPVPGSLSPAVANEATEPCTGVCGNTSHARMHGCPRLMRWREVRLLLLGVLVGSLAYNSWKSHSLVHVIWAPLSVRLSPMLLGVSRAQTAPSQAVGLPEQPTAGGNTHVKAVKIKVRKGPASEGEQKVRLAIRRHQVTPNNSTLRTADAESSFAAEASKVDSLQAATQLEALDSRTADGSGYDTVKQGPSVGEALDGTASQVSINTEEVAGFWEHGSDSVEGIIRKGRGGAKLPVQGAIRKAADVPVAPAGQSCESWLSQADAHTYERDFQRQPITVLEPSGLGADLPDCTVPCKIVGNSFGQNNEGMAAYDAHFGDSSKGQGLSVLRNMESMTNYPNLAVESAHADGYDIVMTTRLDSDVPASYLSWAEYMVMKPLAPKQEDVAAFISNCGAKSFRLQALEALSANFTVHSYGRCMHNKDTIEPKPDVLQRYRFTLAFENSQELDYVTEKYIQALEAGSVPIVIGATNIADYEVAPNSMLVLESMNDMAQVAARMLYLIKNATAYNEMLAWKARGPQDKFLALLDLSVVHSSCSLCIHLATRIRAGEEAAQPRQPPCSCRHGPGGPVVHHVLVRERGRFDTRDVFLKGNNMTVAGLHAAIQQAFNNAKHVPIWRSHRPDFKSGNWQTGSDAPVELRIYRVYQVGRTQRAALYGEASLDTDAKVAEVLETNPCAKLEVVFI